MATGLRHSQLKGNATLRTRLKTSQVVILLLTFIGSIAIGHAGYQRFSPKPAAVAPTTTVPVQRGSISATINTMGSIAAISQSKLTFDAAGRLTEVLVKAGDSVKEGAALARIDSADLEIQVAQAEVALEQAKVKLAQTQEGTKEAEVAAARANYESASTKYNDLKAGPKPEEVASAQSAVRDAEVALSNAKNSLLLVQKGATVSKNVRDRENEHNWYEVTYGATLAQFNQGQASQKDLDQDWSNLLTAKERLDTARAEAEMALRKAENDVVKAEDSLAKSHDNVQKLLAGATPEQLKSAEAAMLTAQSQLEAKTTGPSATDIAAQEVAVRLAEATLKQRQILLERATLVAPFDGVIDSIKANVGEQVSASAEVMTIVNMQRFRIDGRVDEMDVSQLKVGQTAAITLDALPEERITARVTFIGASATVQQGVVSYPFVLELEPGRASVRPGMTANAVIEVTRRDNVLLVPNRAMKTQGRNRTVEVMADGKPATRTISAGMSNDQFTEVVSGLQEGDQVIIPSTTTAAPRIPQSGGLGGMPGIGGGGEGGFRGPVIAR